MGETTMSYPRNLDPRAVGLAAVAAAVDSEARNRHILFVIALSFCLAVAFCSVLLAPTQARMKVGAAHETFTPRASVVVFETPRMTALAFE